MLYQRKTFSLPTASGKVSDKTWDRAFLSKEQYESKYGAETKSEFSNSLQERA